MTAEVRARERELPSLTHLQGSIIILLTGVGFSFGGLAFRSVDIGSWEYLFFRGLGMGAVAVAVLAVRYRNRIGDLTDRLEPGHFYAGVILGGMNILFIVSLSFASVAFVVILQTISPLTASYFSWLILSERPKAKVLIATAVSMVGVAIMVGGSIADDLSLLGLIAAIIPIGFGLYTTLVRSATRIDAMVPLVVAAGCLLAVGIATVVLQGGFEATTRDAIIGVLAGSVLLAVPLSAFNIAQRVVPASESSLLIMTETVLAPVWVWAFLGESAAATTILGGAIIMLAVVWVTINRRPPKGRRMLTSRG